MRHCTIGSRALIGKAAGVLDIVVIGVQAWAEIRRLHRVGRLSIREIGRPTGLHRERSASRRRDVPPRDRRTPAESKRDPLKGWIEAHSHGVAVGTARVQCPE
jgi:hypothetical protein